MQHQISALADLYKSPYDILITQKAIKAVLVNVLNNITTVGNWSDKIRVVEWQELLPQISSYNTSISFVTTRTYAKALITFQKIFDIQGYYIIDFTLNSRMAGYIVNDAFPFIERFNEIINWMRSAGLFEKWRIDDVDEGAVISKKYRLLENSPQSSDTEGFPIPVFIFYGYGLSAIMFVIEIISKFITLSWIMRFRRCFSTK